jgi:hypothetical protein
MAGACFGREVVEEAEGPRGAREAPPPRSRFERSCTNSSGVVMFVEPARILSPLECGG